MTPQNSIEHGVASHEAVEHGVVAHDTVVVVISLSLPLCNFSLTFSGEYCGFTKKLFKYLNLNLN